MATICWVVESFFATGKLAQALKIGEYSYDRAGKDFIDIDTRLKDKSK